MIDIKQADFSGRRVLLHVLFWIGYILFFILQSAFINQKINYLASAASLTLTATIDIAASYFTVYYLLPAFLLMRKYLAFALLFLVSASLAIVMQRVLLYYVIYPNLFPEHLSGTGSFWNINPFYSFLNIYSVVAVFAAFRLLKFWYRNQQVKAELESKNKTSELALLRTQLNPHFLFNTLNNIDALIMTNPPKASDAVIKLSEIMRFMLYDTGSDAIPVDKEVNYLKSYISLQQIRLKDPGFVRLTVTGDFSGKSIAPVLFIPFVENAFKHGLKYVDPPGITIMLDCRQESVTFEVRNRVDPDIEINKDGMPGVGLANTRRRLELLYPARHELRVFQENSEYVSRLKIIF